MFGRLAPVEVEIGSGDGTFLLTVAQRVPGHDFFGIERSPSKARRLEARVAKSGSGNVRTLQGDATCIVAALVPAASVTAYHVYFPDPWPKRGHAIRRIFQAPFIAELGRTLAPGGRLLVATDVAPYAGVIDVGILRCGLFVAAADEIAGVGLETSFARKYHAAGRTLHAAVYRRTDDAPVDQPLAASKMRSM